MEPATWKSPRWVSAWAAVERGVTFLDTAQVCGPFTNEELVGEALEPMRDSVVIATKFGWDMEGGRQNGLDRQTIDLLYRRLRSS